MLGMASHEGESTVTCEQSVNVVVGGLSNESCFSRSFVLLQWLRGHLGQ
jgi:hypothetical protein